MCIIALFIGSLFLQITVDQTNYRLFAAVTFLCTQFLFSSSIPQLATMMVVKP